MHSLDDLDRSPWQQNPVCARLAVEAGVVEYRESWWRHVITFLTDAGDDIDHRTHAIGAGAQVPSWI